MTKVPIRQWSENVKTESIAAKVVYKLGGVSELHRASAPFRNGKGFPTSTIWSWMEKGHIPKKNWATISDVANEKGVKVSLNQLEKALPARG